MPGTHSVIAPSSMARTVQCHGHIKMSEGIEQEETEESREGDATHWVGQTMLTSITDSSNRRTCTSVDFVDKTAPNGVLITQEMYDAANIYYRKVMDIAGNGHMNELNVERTVAIPQIHELCFGTPDANLYMPDKGELHVWDLKYGHRSVRAFENHQCIAYAIGRIGELFPAATAIPNIKIIIHIVQPRCYDGLGVERVWETDYVSLRPFLNKMEFAAHQALGANPTVTVGKECRDCLARHKCDSLLEYGQVSIEYARKAIPRDLSDAALGYELTVLHAAMDIIKYRKEALEAEALARRTIPGWSIEQGMSNKKWLTPPDDVFAMGDILGVNLRNDPKPCTPTQAVDRCKKAKVDPSVFDAFVGRSPSTLKLVPEDTSIAREIFNKERL